MDRHTFVANYVSTYLATIQASQNVSLINATHLIDLVICNGNHLYDEFEKKFPSNISTIHSHNHG